MSNNWREDNPDYKMSVADTGAKVFRPHSLRLVSAELELNRLKATIKHLQEAIEAVNLLIEDRCGHWKVLVSEVREAIDIANPTK